MPSFSRKMLFLIAITILLSIYEVKCCQRSFDTQAIESEIADIANHEDIAKLVVEVEHMESKLDNLKVVGGPTSDTAEDVEDFKMMDKADCTPEIIGNRKIACGDLDKISACTCKSGKQYKKDEKFSKDCKVDFCTCLDSSVVKLFGLHRKLLNCIAI